MGELTELELAERQLAFIEGVVRMRPATGKSLRKGLRATYQGVEPPIPSAAWASRQTRHYPDGVPCLRFGRACHAPRARAIGVSRARAANSDGDDYSHGSDSASGENEGTDRAGGADALLRPSIRMQITDVMHGNLARLMLEPGAPERSPRVLAIAYFSDRAGDIPANLLHLTKAPLEHNDAARRERRPKWSAAMSQPPAQSHQRCSGLLGGTR